MQALKILYIPLPGNTLWNFYSKVLLITVYKDAGANMLIMVIFILVKLSKTN